MPHVDKCSVFDKNGKRPIKTQFQKEKKEKQPDGTSCSKQTQKNLKGLSINKNTEHLASLTIYPPILGLLIYKGEY